MLTCRQLEGNFNQLSKTNGFEYVVCKKSAILFMPRCVKPREVGLRLISISLGWKPAGEKIGQKHNRISHCRGIAGSGFMNETLNQEVLGLRRLRKWKLLLVFERGVGLWRDLHVHVFAPQAVGVNRRLGSASKWGCYHGKIETRDNLGIAFSKTMNARISFGRAGLTLYRLLSQFVSVKMFCLLNGHQKVLSQTQERSFARPAKEGVALLEIHSH